MKNYKMIKYVLGFLAMVAVFSLVVMLLWNWIVPGVFGLQLISFWQALGLLVLSRLFFGGFGKFWLGSRMNDRRHRNPIYEKWAGMSDEERKEFAKRRHQHFKRDFFDQSKFEQPNFDK